MGTVNASITKVLTVLVDIEKKNYQVPELTQYYNDAIHFLSKELAKWQARIGITDDTLTFVANDFVEDLPDGFIALATNEKGEERIFNASNDYCRLKRAEVSEMDKWENQTNADAGTPVSFILHGTQMYINPRPEASTTVKFYYHPLESIVDDSSTMPWSGWFDDPIEQFVLRQCSLRSEMSVGVQVYEGDYKRLAGMAKQILMQREGNVLPFGFHSSFGWR